MRFSSINMSSPGLPMVPQWLKRALGILLDFGKQWKIRRADLECGQIGHHKGPSCLPFLCLAHPENLAHQWDNELQLCERHMFVCACDYTDCNARVVHFFVIWITVLLASEVVVPRQRAEGLRRDTITGNNLFLLHVVVQSTSDWTRDVGEPDALVWDS